MALNNGQTLGGVLQVQNPGDKGTLSVLRGSSTTQLQLTLARPPRAAEPLS